MIKRIGDIVLIQLSDVDSNIYLLDDTVIDAGTGFNMPRLMTLLRVLKKKFGDFKQLVNTHEHFDHTGGDGYFTEAKIIAHEKAAPVMEKADKVLSMADFFDGNPTPKQVATKLKDGDKVKAGKREFLIIHTPGHSPGSVCLYEPKEKLLISGDTVFSDGVGRVDLEGSDPEAMGESLEKLSKLKVEKILPGHGDPVLKGGSKVIADILKGEPEE